MEASLVTVDDTSFHSNDALIAELASQFMSAYESETSNVPETTFVLPPMKPVPRSIHTNIPLQRTKPFYRQVFGPSGERTKDFETYTSEVLAWLLEHEFDTNIYLDKPRAHTNIPTFDVLAIGTDEYGLPFIKVVQVKATNSNLSHNCGVALSKFELLAQGHYDQALLSELKRISKQQDFPQDVDINELFFQHDLRYRITVLHGGRHASAILTTYSQHLPGHSSRRSVRLIEVSWSEFWEKLQGYVYDQLA